MCVQRAHKGMSQTTGRSIRDQRCKELTPLLDGFSTLEAFLGPKAHQSLCWVLYFAVTVIWSDILSLFADDLSLPFNEQGLQGLQKKAFSQEVRLLACS